MATKKDQDKWPRTVKNGFASVKVYRVKAATTKDGFAYTVAYSDGGHRKLKKFSDPERALRDAARRVEDLAQGNHQAARFTVEDAQLLQSVRRIAGETPVMIAMEEWEAAKKLCGGDLMAVAKAFAKSRACKNITIKKAVDEFRAEKLAAGREVRVSYKYLIHLSQSSLAERKMRDVSPGELSDWMAGKYLTPVYFNTALRKLTTLWGWAQKHEFVPMDSQLTPEKIERRKEKKVRIGIINPEQLGKILKAVREKQPAHLAVAVLSSLAGLRTYEAERQLWSDIYLDRKEPFLKVSEVKENTPAFRNVPLCPAAVAWLQICPNREGSVGTHSTAIELTRDVAREIGIDIPDNAYRHSYISHAVELHQDVPKVALWAGNSPKKIFSNYRQLVTAQEAGSWFAMGPKEAGVII